MTIPPDVLLRADQLAAEWDRSRSWVLSEAIRRLDGQPDPKAAALLVSEPAAEPSATQAVSDARRCHLVHALSLSPGERLKQAEELIELARKVRKRARRHQIIGFDSLEDFARWKKARRAGA